MGKWFDPPKRGPQLQPSRPAQPLHDSEVSAKRRPRDSESQPPAKKFITADLNTQDKPDAIHKSNEGAARPLRAKIWKIRLFAISAVAAVAIFVGLQINKSDRPSSDPQTIGVPRTSITSPSSSQAPSTTLMPEKFQTPISTIQVLVISPSPDTSLIAPQLSPPVVSIDQTQQSRTTDPRFGTCREAKSHGYGPYIVGVHEEYNWYRDADSDGIVCE